MAGISTPIYRALCRKMGATAAFTEMISARGLVSENSRTLEALSIAPDEHPVGAQLFGTDPGIMAEAAQIAADAGFDLIDINMGCPVRKVVSNGAGCALMENSSLACEIVRTMIDRIDLPVTAKIRSGWSHERLNAVQFGKALEASGLSALIVHPRTRDQGYAGRADWRVIAQVKEHLDIPVIGNGDVIGGDSANRLRQQTQCDGIMIGRAALGNPWIFSKVLAALQDRSDDRTPSREERYQTFLMHFEGLQKELGEVRGSRHMKRFGAWYIRGFRGASAARAALHRSRTPEQIIRIVESVLTGSN
jgi:nifR3 family TIM-barrel protein